MRYAVRMTRAAAHAYAEQPAMVSWLLTELDDALTRDGYTPTGRPSIRYSTQRHQWEDEPAVYLMVATVEVRPND